MDTTDRIAEFFQRLELALDEVAASLGGAASVEEARDYESGRVLKCVHALWRLTDALRSADE